MNTLIATIAIIIHTAAPATFCAGTKIDHTMTYSQWLHAYALDLNVAAQYLSAHDEAGLLAAKFTAYVNQSKYVRRGQVQLCGQDSNNWN